MRSPRLVTAAVISTTLLAVVAAVMAFRFKAQRDETAAQAQLLRKLCHMTKMALKLDRELLMARRKPTPKVLREDNPGDNSTLMFYCLKDEFDIMTFYGCRERDDVDCMIRMIDAALPHVISD